MGVVKDTVLRSGWHWEFGWLRRKDLDDAHGYCYEEPDGDLVYFADRINSNMVYLDERLDPVTGEAYLCLGDPCPPLEKVQAFTKLYMKLFPLRKV